MIRLGTSRAFGTSPWLSRATTTASSSMAWKGTASRGDVTTSTSKPSPLPLQPSLQHFHSSSKNEQADATTMVAPSADATTSSVSSTWLNRWIVTAEVAVSKIFPGGFGWQTGSLVAANYYNYASDSMNFAICTGVGDAVGVFGGHCLYYSLKGAVSPSIKIDMVKEMHTGMWLGCAAFCSGTVWQPIVTTLQLANCSFNEVMIGTWLTCSTAFYIGLRAGRTLLPLPTLASPSYGNSQTDIALSISIGGATGFFVGTSTALGFVTSQAVLNTIYPKTKCWND